MVAAIDGDGGRALPHRVKRSRSDVGDVVVIVAAAADCGPVAAVAARVHCEYLMMLQLNRAAKFGDSTWTGGQATLGDRRSC